MIIEEAQRLAKQFNIAPTQVVREEWEIKILTILFNLPIGNKLYFKGGTAVRLAYGSPRFSEDLDFSMIKTIREIEFKNFVKEVVKKYPELTLSDLKAKFYTLLAEFKIKESFLAQNFSIKIEVSKRKKPVYQSSIRLLTSPTTNLQVLGRVETIEDLYHEKLTTYIDRRKPRDLFDIWFMCQKMKNQLPTNLPKIAKMAIRQELGKYLPRSYTSVVTQLEQTYGR